MSDLNKSSAACPALSLLREIEHHLGTAESHLTHAMLQLLKASHCHTEAVKQRAYAADPDFYTRLQNRLHKLVSSCRQFQN